MLKKIFFLGIALKLSFSLNLDKELEHILKLPPQERYKALNKLKQQILKLNEKEREKIIKKLLSHYHINDTPPESIIKGNK